MEKVAKKSRKRLNFKKIRVKRGVALDESSYVTGGFPTSG